MKPLTEKLRDLLHEFNEQNKEAKEEVEKNDEQRNLL